MPRALAAAGVSFDPFDENPAILASEAPPAHSAWRAPARPNGFRVVRGPRQRADSALWDIL